MNIKINRIATLLLIGVTGLVSGCYDKFDVDSYKPVFTISGFSAADEIQPSKISAYWSLDGSLNDIKTGTESANKGTSFVKGFKGQALSLSASNKTYVTYADPSVLTNAESFTISFWVNPTFVDADGDKAIDGIIGFFNLANTGAFWGNLDWFVENGTTVDAAKIVVHVVNDESAAPGDESESWFNVSGYKGLFGNWSNHTLTYDASTSKFTYYINGAKATTATAPWTGKTDFRNSGPLVFGTVQFQTIPSSTSDHGAEPWASYLTGSMDEIRVYSTVLTETEVNALVVLQGKGK